jgi:hypothetical protein
MYVRCIEISKKTMGAMIDSYATRVSITTALDDRGYPKATELETGRPRKLEMWMIVVVFYLG